jgi:RNA recognition motif-containing protein
MVKLFVGGFPLDIEEIELVKLFNVFTEIKTIKIVRDKVTKKCKGYAFLETTGMAGAEMAINALDGKMMAGKALSVRVAEEPKEINNKPGLKRYPAQPASYIKVERSQEVVKKKRPRIS